MSSPIDGGTVVVTGASSGIGRDICRAIAPRAKKLVLVARRTERLEELARELEKESPSLKTIVIGADLSDRGATRKLIADLAARAGDVDVLVNNAGVGDLGLFERTDIERQLVMIELNVVSLVMLTRALLPGMVERRRGAVLMVSSGFGLTFLPSFAGYIGTKHFVTGFTEALRLELAGTGVRVGQVCPGPVATEFEANIGNFTGMKTPGLLELSSRACARVCVRAIDRGHALVVPHVLVWLAVLITRFTPRWLVRLVLWPAGRKARALQRARATAG